ncbi:MAG: hypothetical protein IT360_16250, partial [Gemmatimonadaceae bacterium]|nr:hypothetical protein [Gemmatimonadaceae bacterium]
LAVQQSHTLKVSAALDLIRMRWGARIRVTDPSRATTLLLDVEQIEDRWIGHVTGWPGIYVDAGSRDALLAAAPATVAARFAWLREGGESPPSGPFEFTVNEVHAAWSTADGYEVNAFFAADRQPLSPDECATAIHRLGCYRDALLAACGPAQDASSAIRERVFHVADAENWYLESLDAGDARLLDDADPFGSLERVRDLLVRTLPALAGDDRIAVRRGEVWSARKVVRRALWHERHHAEHIQRLRGA